METSDIISIANREKNGASGRAASAEVEKMPRTSLIYVPMRQAISPDS